MRVVLSFLAGIAIGGLFVSQTFTGGTIFGSAVPDCYGLELSNPLRPSDGVTRQTVCVGWFDVVFPEVAIVEPPAANQ